jgi:hypothetical protein
VQEEKLELIQVSSLEELLVMVWLLVSCLCLVKDMTGKN